MTASALSCLFMVSCSKDFLKEKPVSEQTAETYYATAQGFEDLVRSCYALLRDIHQQRDLVYTGTDIFASSKWNEVDKPGASGDAFDTYDIRLNSGQGVLSTHWQTLYQEISRANTAIDQAPKVGEISDDLRKKRVAEAKFLRALSFFYAVQHWGDIPMPLTPTTSANKAVVREPSANVYTQIINDLLECETNLPTATDQPDYGRVTKGAAQFLLSKVYLTRGWNFNNALGGSNDDFNKALQYADKVIAAYPLVADYTKLWPQHSENPTDQPWTAESSVAAIDKRGVIFSVQYSKDKTLNGTGNNLHSIFGGEVESIPGALARTPDYNRLQGKHITTTAMYRLFDPQLDTRYQWNFVDALIALKDVASFTPRPGASSISFEEGDTVIVFQPWNEPALTAADRGMDVEGGTKKYAVINTDEFASRTDVGAYKAEWPLMFKFWQPGIPYGDGDGTADEPIFRVAEAYLIAAEAIVKGTTGNGALGGAEVYYNKVLDRALGVNGGADPHRAADPGNPTSLATVSYRATSSNINIEMILDERARELMGEYGRWFDLKRTKTLLDRVKNYNPWGKKAGEQFNEKDYLRPIPQSEIDLSSPAIGQNPS